VSTDGWEAPARRRQPVYPPIPGAWPAPADAEGPRAPSPLLIAFVSALIGALLASGVTVAALRQTGQAILSGIGRKAADQLKPRTLFADIIETVADQHAIILNRTREASMLLPGKSLLVYELEPALFATVAANEAEKAAPGITLIDLQMIGASGRLFIAGTTRECELARDRIDEVLGAIEGRQSGR